MHTYDYEPRITLKPNAMYFYSLPVVPYKRTQIHTGNLYKYNNGIVGDKQAKRIREIVNVLSIIAKWKGVYSKEKELWFKFKLSFITLTLPKTINKSDKEIMQEIFSPLMNRIQKQRPELLYIYKAETSDNGRLHLHITTNIFIHHKKLREMYLSQLKKAGVLDENDKRDYPCTEVKAVRNVKNIAGYMSAYICKKDVYKKPLKKYLEKYKKQLRELTDTSFQLPKNYYKNLKRKVTCRIWDASKCLKIRFPSESPGDSVVASLVRQVELHPEYLFDRLDYIGIGRVNKAIRKDIPSYIQYIKKHFKEAVSRETKNQSHTYVESL